MSKYTLTQEQRELLERDINGKFNQYTANERQRAVYTKVISMAEEAMGEGGDTAFDLMMSKYGGSVMKWFYHECL